MNVSVVRQTHLLPAQADIVDRARLRPLICRCAVKLDIPEDMGLTICLTDDDHMADLNSTFLGHTEPTDVLAFPAADANYLGDIAISVERACANVTDPVGELRLLCIHGLLHCLGHDHATREQAAQMTVLTQQLLPRQAIPALEASE